MGHICARISVRRQYKTGGAARVELPSFSSPRPPRASPFPSPPGARAPVAHVSSLCAAASSAADGSRATILAPRLGAAAAFSRARAHVHVQLTRPELAGARAPPPLLARPAKAAPTSHVPHASKVRALIHRAVAPRPSNRRWRQHYCLPCWKLASICSTSIRLLRQAHRA